MKLFLSLFLFSNSIAFSFLKNSEKYIKFELIKKEENKDIKIAKKNFLFYLFRIFLCILFCFIIYVCVFKILNIYITKIKRGGMRFKSGNAQYSANYTNSDTDLDKLYKQINSKENIEFMKKFKIDGKCICEHFTEIHNSKSNENYERIKRLFLAIHPDRNNSKDVKQDSMRVTSLVNSYRKYYKNYL